MRSLKPNGLKDNVLAETIIEENLQENIVSRHIPQKILQKWTFGTKINQFRSDSLLYMGACLAIPHLMLYSIFLLLSLCG